MNSAAAAAARNGPAKRPRRPGAVGSSWDFHGIKTLRFDDFDGV